LGTRTLSEGSETNLQKAILELDAFSGTKFISVSAVKTKAAIFHNKQNVRILQLYIKDTLIQLESNPVILGLILDQRLTWNAQVEAVKQYWVKRIPIIRRLTSLSWAISPKNLLDFYKRFPILVEPFYNL
jgi:hypothetical protein